MAQEKKRDECTSKEAKQNDTSRRIRKDKTFQTKVVMRRLPPTMTEEQFIEQISPVPDHGYMYFVKGDMRLGMFAFSRAYINFINQEDIFIFKDRFDGYVFLDNKGNEYPAIVEFAPFQKIPKKRTKKKDAKCATIEQDPDYIKFLESLQTVDETNLPTAEAYLEEIEAREKELKANHGVLKLTTPLIEYLKQRKMEQQKLREEKREERKRRELEKKRLREEERRRRKAEKEREKMKDKPNEKDSSLDKEIVDETEDSQDAEDSKHLEPIVVLKNPEREKEKEPKIHNCQTSRIKEITSGTLRNNKNRERGRREWEREREKQRERLRTKERERQREKERITAVRERERTRREINDHRVTLHGVNHEMESTGLKHCIFETHEKKKSQDMMDIGRKTTRERIRLSPGERDEVFDRGTIYDKWMKREKRDSSCPANVESLENRTNKLVMQNNSTQIEEKSNLEHSNNGEKLNCIDDTVRHDASPTDSKERLLQIKDPRVERRIRNKDRPSLEIYRPGMRRLSTQRNSPQKEVSTSASNSSSPSPTPLCNKAQSNSTDRVKPNKHYTEDKCTFGKYDGKTKTKEFKDNEASEILSPKEKESTKTADGLNL